MLFDGLVSETIPNGLLLLSMSHGCVQINSDVDCDLSSLDPADSRTFNFVFEIPLNFTNGNITNFARSFSPNDPDPNNNAASTTINFTTVSSDWGDAPDTYKTLSASMGPSHDDDFVKLGTLWDSEGNGQPSVNADGDDINGIDDEDGVTFPSPIIVGNNTTVEVESSGLGALNAWLDFNIDGDFADANEQIFTDVALSAGVNPLVFSVPANATDGDTYSRWRISTQSGLSFTGPAIDGEVEDQEEDET